MSNSTEGAKYEVLQNIGRGSFGVIQKVRRVSDGQILCRKEVNYVKMSMKEREQLHAEFSILSSLRHPNIVKYFHREHLKSTQDLHLYMEYCGGGDLSQVIKNLEAKNQYAEEEFVWTIFAQLVTALYRCHYGTDPPDVGTNFMGRAPEIKQPGLRRKDQITILHRDLKPENVFLSEDSSVKLGDFGLSKLMQSHDFASTYVGTPFYMSPEICAAERYTLKSDIWSLGCIIYELCTRKPPFNAKTHFQLVNRIKDGQYKPLPSMYSPELQAMVKNCLNTSPNHRPDTAALLKLPVVRLLRKEREVVEIGNVLRSKDEEATAKLKELHARLAKLDIEKDENKQSLESALRREWELKARLEIDRQVKLEVARVEKKMELAFQSQLQAEVEMQLRSMNTSRDSSGAHSPTENPASSISTSNDTDIPSSQSTDSTSLSLGSPSFLPSNPPRAKRSKGTPFTRARTQYDSPMDIQMVDPSPMSISSLSLSPRRAAAVAAVGQYKPQQNIFTAGAEQRERWRPHLLSPTSSDNNDEDDEEDLADSQPSPTSRLARPRSATAVVNPFPSKATKRPSLTRQQTMPVKPSDGDVLSEDVEFSDLPELASPTHRLPRSESAAAVQDPFKSNAVIRPSLTRQQTAPANRLQAPQPALFAKDNTNIVISEATSPTSARAPSSLSPNRPSPISPTRRIPVKNSKANKAALGGDPQEMLKTALHRKMGMGVVAGRTLAELNQARAPGGPVSPAKQIPIGIADFGEGGVRIAARVMDIENNPATTWDPERDEMPSPFLARQKRPMQGGLMGYGLGR